MAAPIKILPRSGYQYRDTAIRIAPRPSYRPPTMHSQVLRPSGPLKGLDVEWCPICHSGRDKISEVLQDNTPKWVCGECGYEW